MAILSGFLVLGISLILQTTIISQIHLLSGNADLVMLSVLSWSLFDQVEITWEWAIIAGVLVGTVSALPFWAPVLSYILIALLVQFIKQRVWQIPILELFTAIFFSTLIYHAVSFLAVTLAGTQLSLTEVFNLITLPSLILNLLGAIPVNGLSSEIALWFFPDDSDES